MIRKYLFDLCNILLLVVTSVILLVGYNADVLYTAQDRSLCLCDFSVFLQQVQNAPDGMLAWTGSWLTQLFYYTWLGTSVLIVIWIAIYFILARAFAIPQHWRWLILIPLFSLLASEIELGYWIYYLKQPGYWFRESVGLLCVSLLLWIQPNSSDKSSLTFNLRRWAAPIVAILTYPLIGWYALLALAAMAIRSLTLRQWTISGVSLLLGLLTPPALIRYYTGVRAADAWMVGFPFIESNQNFSWALTLPFIFMAIAVLCIAACRHWMEYKKWHIYLQSAGMLVLLQYVVFSNFSDYNYHVELEMYRDLEEFRCDRLIRRFNDLPEGPTRQMVMCKNICLINLRHLGDGLFQYPNIGPDPNVNNGLEMHTAQTAAPMFYLQHGLANDAIHWSIENSVEYGLTVNDLRIMTLGAILNGENQLARKYINMLNHTLFGPIWTKRYYPLTIHPEWIKDYPELRVMKELHDSDIEYIVGDQGDCEFRIYRHFSNTLYNKNPLFQEVSLAYSLMLKEREIGMIQLQTYHELHPRQKLPLHYEEARVLFQKMATNTLTKAEVDQMIKAIHGKSYMWFFFNVNDAKTY